MSLAVLGGVLLLAGLAAVATGVLPVPDVLALVDRVGPILGFVAAMTVVTELCSEAGVFRWVAGRLRHWGRGRAWLLWLLVAGIAVASTVFLSLDTTAVLLTPVVVQVARQAGLPPLPFALITVWLANTASLLLPISNLTNLLAQRTLGGLAPWEFAAATAAPALAAVVVPLALAALIFRRDLRKPYASVPVHRLGAGSASAAAPDDPLLLGTGAVVLCLLLPALVSGLPVWLPSTAAALALAVVFAARRRVLTPMLVPWSLLLFSGGLFLVMAAAARLGLPALLTAVAGRGESAADLFRLAGTGAVAANVANNLPAYLALEPVAGSPDRLVALLIGVNAGPVITPWASLATLLWHDRLVKMNVLINWWGYAVLGLILAPLVVGLGVLALVPARG
ncbi:SLC13 family permease [Specibacter cremeus]|uniref:SLC13 family permease n=1 Tax=Specibacter cremeus TaxID=1629051 RepID=UPI000F799D64|nr:SLC13 family permease [Specibacter cremeus]